jgi:hypothetical protein
MFGIPDPPNAVLTWFDGDEMKESEVVITGASVSANGRSISYDVSVEAGTLLAGQMRGVSLFVDSGLMRVDMTSSNGIIWCPLCAPPPGP